mmetsp:Transcript_27752/g.38608  ORF Transcript_27752/g.38608 Transcript_27752/m.38608 type:complete len:103 (+) Transcript_27752:108-416(+)
MENRFSSFIRGLNEKSAFCESYFSRKKNNIVVLENKFRISSNPPLPHCLAKDGDRNLPTQSFRLGLAATNKRANLFQELRDRSQFSQDKSHPAKQVSSIGIC